MKTATLILFLFANTCLLPAQENKNSKLAEANVPSAVKTKFHALYPDIKAEKWEMEHGNYEAGFHKNKTEMSVLIDATGNLLETETEIPVSELPKTVTEYVTKQKPGKKIKEASKIIDATGLLTYEAEVEKTDLVFDQNGNFVKEVND